ncbi:MAG: hypothetical protein JJE16_14110 [Nitrospiraceae bacterium]|nr:hypothetical protein [Nitrospiraceae bacterium]
MVSIPKVVGLLSCGFVLCLGLSTAAHAGQADEPGASRLERAKTIKGVLLRVEYGEYVVKGQDGMEVRLTTDKTTQMMGQLKKGDRIEAKVNDQNHALLIRSTQ